MGREDWYRNTEWTDEIRNAFLARLGRSRIDFNKAQYAFIQAGCLSSTGEAEKVRAALEVADIVLEECPSTAHLPGVYQVRANCFEFLGDMNAAVSAWRECARSEKAANSISVDGPLGFAGFVVKHGLTDHYDEALSCFVPSASLVFSSRQFEIAAVFAILLDHRCMYRKARRWAEEALNLHAVSEENGIQQAVNPVLLADDALLQRLEMIRDDKKGFMVEWLMRLTKMGFRGIRTLFRTAKNLAPAYRSRAAIESSSSTGDDRAPSIPGA